MYINKKTIEKIKGKNNRQILVIGDVILDRYWFGDVNRISPEAPVPIAKIEKIVHRPGGAANVACNIANLGGDVTLLSVTGDDLDAKILTDILIDNKVKVLFKKDKDNKTIIKLRIISKNQQLIRLDFENNPTKNILQSMVDEYSKIIDKYDVLILSDYGKGGLDYITSIIKIASRLNKPILIDPKGNDYSKYKNATLITPNKNELRNIVGEWKSEEELQVKVNTLIKRLNLKYLLLTRSEEGMTLYSANNKKIHHNTKAKEIYDVSGAGDTVIATIGLMLTKNISLDSAINIANVAAGIVIGKVGTATTTKKELLKELDNFVKK